MGDSGSIIGNHNIDNVSSYITSMPGEETFTGVWMLVVEWNNVSLSGSAVSSAVIIMHTTIYRA